MMSTAALRKADHSEDIFYPDTDGEPMAEGDIQRDALIYCVEALRHYFRAEPDVYVSGNLLFYYEQGNPYKSFAPDVFVVFGVPNYKRPIYKIWEEGKAPDFIIEITSKTTRKKDRDNVRLYRKLGVQEYFMFDPTGDYLDPVLQCRRLSNGRYYLIKTQTLPDGTLKADSLILGLELRVQDGGLHFYHSGQQEYLFTYTEEKDGRLWAEARAKRESFRAEKEKARADSAEEEVRQLKAKLRESGILKD
jgi:Uma2 family endonuclease